MAISTKRSKTSVNHARRGMSLESYIDFANLLYLQKDIAVINKRPTPIKVIRMNKNRITDGVYEKPSTVDYDGTYREKSIVFEAKSTQELTRFPLSNVEDHQADYLERCHRHGAICFLLIEFAAHRTVYLLPYDSFRHYWQARKPGTRGTQSIPLADLEVNAYEVESGRVGLDYLKVVDRIWMPASS